MKLEKNPRRRKNIYGQTQLNLNIKIFCTQKIRSRKREKKKLQRKYKWRKKPAELPHADIFYINSVFDIVR